MLRYFAKLVRVKDGYGMTMFVLDFNLKTVQQINTDGSGQVAEFTDFKYKEDRRELLFVVGHKIVETRIDEISAKLFLNLRKPHNWQSLCHGLRIKSKKTVDWLVNVGKIGRASCREGGCQYV